MEVRDLREKALTSCNRLNTKLLSAAELADFYSLLAAYTVSSGKMVLEEIQNTCAEKLMNDLLKAAASDNPAWAVFDMAARTLEKYEPDPDSFYMHLMGILLVQNGCRQADEKLAGLVKILEKYSSRPERKRPAAMKYIKKTDGRMLDKNEYDAAELLRGRKKNYAKAEMLLKKMDPDSMHHRSLYSLALLQYMDYGRRPENMKKGILYCAQAAAAGNTEAAFTAGYQLLHGVPGFSSSLNDLLKEPDEKSAVLGYTFYPDEIKTAVHVKRGLSFLAEAAKRGSAAAWKEMAEYYAKNGEPGKALAMLEKSAELGSHTAAEALGDYYSGGIGTSDSKFLQDLQPTRGYPEKAVYYYRLRQDINPAVIPRILDTVFDSGDPENWSNILEDIYSETLKLPWGFAEAQSFIAQGQAVRLKREDFAGIGYFGNILSRDLPRAFRALKKAYDGGRKTGYTVYLYGILHLAGFGGLPENPAKAHELFMEAADLGFSGAAAIAGRSCHTGGRAFFPEELKPGHESSSPEEKFISAIPALLNDPANDSPLNLKNPVLAEKYLLAAADAGNRDSCELLAQIYLADNRRKEGYEYTEKASRYGSAQSSMTMAALCAGLKESALIESLAPIADASDIKKDFSRAGFYCRLSGMQGNSSARQRLAQMLLEGPENQEAHEFANMLLIDAAGEGSKTALIMLGLNHANGTGHKKDRKEAFRLLTSCNDGIGPRIENCIYDSDSSTDYDLEKERALFLADYYITGKQGNGSNRLSVKYAELAAKLELKKKQTETMISKLIHA